MTGTQAVVVGAVLLAAGLVLGMRALRHRGDLGTPVDRATFATLHTASLVAPHLREGLTRPAPPGRRGTCGPCSAHRPWRSACRAAPWSGTARAAASTRWTRPTRRRRSSRAGVPPSSNIQLAELDRSRTRAIEAELRAPVPCADLGRGRRVGSDPELVRRVLAGESEADSVGLGKVDARPRQVFGDDHGLVVETASGAGTKVSFRLPQVAPGVRAG